MFGRLCMPPLPVFVALTPTARASGLHGMTRRSALSLVAASCLAGQLGQAANQMSRADALQTIAAADRSGDGDQLLKLADDLLARDAEAAEAHYFRGRERFRRGDVAGSVADFDRYVQLRPEREPPQWERGIALYYHAEYARGAKQFELYQTYDDRDVENSVWRYLCLAKKDGVEAARKTMLPIERDPRVPMMDIFRLYAGQAKPDDVLAAAQAGEPSPEVLDGRLFYAHLYLALYYDAAGNRPLVRKYIDLAAEERLRQHPRINAYMWAVARVHQRQLKEDRP
ncbi:MAG: hypothetical protein U0939_23060 [Pirellulales bacterium]